MWIHVRRYLLLGIFAFSTLMLCLSCEKGFSANNSEQKPDAIAEKIENIIKLTEKAEGNKEVVKDEVKVKTDAKGAPVVEQVGKASWYGKDFHGKKTASGEIFDQNDLTAAHPTLPMGTEATVTNLENGKSVAVTINDRGPNSKRRAIDLSKEAGKKIGINKDGVAPVKIEAKVSPDNE